MSLEGIQKVLQVGSLLGSFATRDSWLSYPTPSPPLAAEPSGMLMKTTVPSRSSFDQQGACLADRSRAHEPQEHRAGSESLFTCFWGFEGQTVRVAKKGKLPQGGPQGFCARGARERCAFWPFAVLTSPPAGRLRGAEPWRPASREDRGAAAGKAPKHPYKLLQLFPPIVPPPRMC